MDVLVKTVNDIEVINFEESEIKVNFDQELTTEQIIELLTVLCDKEEAYYRESGNIANVLYNFKNVEQKALVDILRFALERETLINPTLILNISLLIKGFNTLDESLFESPMVYVSDLEQLLDTKLELMDEIKHTQTELSKWYVACLKSACKVEYTYLDEVVQLPTLYKRILTTSDVLTMSQILAKSADFNINSLPLVESAYPVVAEIVECSGLANQLLNLLTKAE